MTVQTLNHRSLNGIVNVGRPKKKEPTRTIRVYKRQGDAITQIANSLNIDTPDLVEEALASLIADKGPAAIERTTEIISPNAPRKGKR